MNFNSGNFYNFLKRLNVLNGTLPDSLKIKEHFTDIGHSLYLVYCYKDPLYSSDHTVNPHIVYRDSLMAQVVIDWYKGCHQKCLVVTNTRHAFAMDLETQARNYPIYKRYFSKNEAQYIYNRFPTTTARVLYFAPEPNNVFLIAQPIHHGKWKRAFKENHDKPVGFDFKNSPFGEDSFDSHYMSILLENIQYQDMFTGMVFYKPQEKYTYTQPWYERYGAEQEYIEASKNNLIDTVCGKQMVERYFDNPESQKELLGLNHVDANWLNASVYYYFDLFLFILTVGIALLLSTVCTFCCLIKKNYKK